MNGQLDSELQRAGHDLVEAWRAPLTELAERWRGRVADWDRVFPGLIAAIGLQSLIWPRCARLVTGDDARTAYALPPTGVAEVFRFAYGHAGGNVGWIAIAAPAMLDWDRLRPIFDDRDVFISLSSLNSENHINVSGRATGLLAPLAGRSFPGDQPAGLPVCDCETISAMLPDWQSTLPALQPALTAAAGAFRASPASGADADEAVATAYGRIAWNAWKSLHEAGVIRLTGGQAVANKSLLGRLFGPRELAPFRGAMLLRGDHWALWEQIKTIIASE